MKLFKLFSGLWPNKPEPEVAILPPETHEEWRARILSKPDDEPFKDPAEVEEYMKALLDPK